MKKVSVIGLGYVGFPTALLLAKGNYKIYGFDIDTKKINSFKKKRFISQDKTLLPLVNNNKILKNISFTKILQPSDIYIICVPTPINKNKSPNISFILKAINEIAKLLKDDDLIIIQSTSPIGTTKRMYNLLSNKTDCNFSMAYCPERVFVGNTIFELRNLDRVIGGIDKQSSHLAKNLFSKITNGKISITNSETAEMIKLAENTYRDVNIALSSELKIISE